MSYWIRYDLANEIAIILIVFIRRIYQDRMANFSIARWTGEENQNQTLLDNGTLFKIYVESLLRVTMLSNIYKKGRNFQPLDIIWWMKKY